MAIINKDSLLSDASGRVGNLVIKRYKNKTVLSAVPDMSGVKPSLLQQETRSRFSAAVAYAKSILADATKKASYKGKVRPGQTVFHYAVREYFSKNC